MENGGPECDRRQFLAQCGAGLAVAALPVQGVPRPGEESATVRRVSASAAQRDTGEDAWRRLQEQFVLKPGLAYLNTGGLGPSPRVVLDTLACETRALEESSETGHEQVDDVRHAVCRFVGCEDDELAFTRNTTEGINIIARGLPLHAGDEVMLTTHEHPGGAIPWLALAQDIGVVVRTFEPGQGGEDTLRNLTASLTSRTRVVSVSHVTCTLGLVLPIKEIVALCRERGIYSVVDGAQAVGQIPVDLHELGCDFYATSGHKWLLGPKGTGLVYVRKELLERWRAVQVGAYSDRKYDLDQGVLERLPAARAVEYGTQNTALVKALGAAVDFIGGLGMPRIAQHGRQLAAYLRSALQRLPAVEILSRAEPELSASIVTFRIARPELPPGEWAERLKNDYRIRVRPVSEHGLSAVRVCTHVFNDAAQLDRLVSALAELTRT